MVQSLFTLLRLGLGTTQLESEDISDLLSFNENQWQQLEETARFQGVSAIVLDGVNVILEERGANCFDHFKDRKFWRRFITSWAYGMVEQGYEARNTKQLKVIDIIQKKWAQSGIRMMVMKGQAMATYYPIPKHRSPGDIDCFHFDNYAKGNEIARSFADHVDEGWYKHSQISFQGELIENHLFFVHTREGKSSKRLNQVMCDSLIVDEFDRLSGTDVLLPPVMFNALFLTYHALTHFLEEGLRLKQILDWALFLRRDVNNVDWSEFYRICDQFHLRRFVDVATDITVHYLGVEIDNPQIMIVSPYTEKVVQSTLYDKDYIFSSGQSGWANRWHIVTNLFKYRWKYHLIYQHGILRQLWWYVAGYLFKTE